MSEGRDAPASAQDFRGRFDRPILALSTPRSGSTLLFETLARAPGLFTAGGESHHRIEQVADFFPGKRGWTSNRLEAADATPEAAEALARTFYEALRDRDGKAAEGKVRVLEKTPKNALRVPFFDAVWGDARFVYLYRDVRQTLASMMEAWASGRFVTYPMLPGWNGPPWSLLLTPGWRELNGLPLPRIVARQWAATTELLVSDLEAVGPERVVGLDYAELVADPQGTMRKLASALGLDWDVELPVALPYSKTTYSKPSADKWRRLEAPIEQVLPLVEAADRRARAFLGTVRR